MPTIKRIIPLLVYKDIPATHDFLVKAFGFEAGGVERNAEGQPIHGEVYAGQATIWLHRATAEHGLDSPGKSSGGQGAAVTAMLAVASTSCGAVLESTFYPQTIDALRAFPGRFVEVRCSCPRDVALDRYRRRATARHAGHLDALRTDDELWNPLLVEPLGLGPVITVDTTVPTDVTAVAAEVTRLFEPSSSWL